MNNKFLRQLEKFNLELSKNNLEKFDKYYELLLKWNKVMNLTAITEYEEVYDKHFIDSLSIVKVIDLKTINYVIDIGTGAGFPGIPLKIAYPHLNLVLLDSLKKRVNFLKTVVEELQLENVELLHGRAEDYAKMSNYREKFDLCVSRAVANLSTLSEYCIPYVRVGGSFISYKSSTVDEEVDRAANTVKILGGKLQKVEKFVLPGTEINRSLINIKKITNTNKKYPRKAGLPAKEPLI